MNFSDLGLSDKTIKAINEFGMKKPTTVQADVIPSILQGKDVFTIAPQKCGKTTSYVFPLVDIISQQNKQNILIITPSSEESVVVSDRLSVFNKYHGIVDAVVTDAEENIDDEANVIIGPPDLLLEIAEDGKVDLSTTDILVVDDINLIKKNKQLDNLQKVLEMLPAEKQNIVYTNRRSKETQDILDRILKTPEEIKVKATEPEIKEPVCPTPPAPQEEVVQKEAAQKPKNDNRNNNNYRNANKYQGSGVDNEAVSLAKKYNSFGGRTPKFIFSKSIVIENE